jgi:DNA-binding winged helix-turn-helix (wHTH) protein
MRVRFGDCVLDTDTRELFRRDKPVHLPPKAFRVLELLVENRPRAVTKDEIHDKIWPGTYVS